MKKSAIHLCNTYVILYYTIGSVTNQTDQPNPQVSIIIACAVDTIITLYYIQEDTANDITLGKQ